MSLSYKDTADTMCEGDDILIFSVRVHIHTMAVRVARMRMNTKLASSHLLEL